MTGQLGLDGMPDRLLKITPSRLSTWSDCRRRFRLVHLDRPAPSRAGAMAHSTLGAVVHNALRALFAAAPARRTPERAGVLLDQHWSDEGFRDPAQAARYRDRAREWVAAYAAEHGSAEPVGLERWVSAPVGTILAEGRVDRIDDRGGELVVVDYKTGRRVPDADDVRSSAALALYAMALRVTLRRDCARVELHHLPSGRVAAAEHDAGSLARHRAAAEESAAAVDDATVRLAAGGDADALFPPSPGPRCGWCDVRRHCPTGRAAAPVVRPWELLAS